MDACDKTILVHYMFEYFIVDCQGQGGESYQPHLKKNTGGNKISLSVFKKSVGLGHLGGSVVECLPLAQAMVPGSVCVPLMNK